MLDELGAAVGRDAAAIERAIQFRINPDDLGETREALRPYSTAGATHIILHLTAPYPVGIVRCLADDIAAPLRDEHQQASGP